jgi:DNA-binding response OmpR family regulator
MESRVLIVDDEKELALILKDFLLAEGIKVETAYNAQDAYKVFEAFNPTLVVLDIMLPDEDGMEICRKIRSNYDIPIIMLSAKDTDMDKILSLGLGADEYLTKPFSPTVVVAHIKALLRRYRTAPKKNSHDIIDYTNFKMDLKRHTLIVEKKNIQLVSKEFDLLWYLAKNEGQVFTKEQLYDAIWGEDEFGEMSTVTVHVRKIRAKFELENITPRFIKTIWGVGYKFEYE